MPTHKRLTKYLNKNSHKMNFFIRFVVDGAYYLLSSKRYQRIKSFFYNLLENDNYPYKRYFDLFMISLIFISVGVLVREVKHHLNDFWVILNNIIISFLFLIEYLLRLWVHSSVSKIIVNEYEDDMLLSRDFRAKEAFKKVLHVKMKYITSFQAIVDLLAVMPFFHEVRLLRLFILFRVFKLFRYSRRFNSFVSVLRSKKFEFVTLFTFAFIVIFVSSVLIYIMEANDPNSQVNTIFDAFYWSIVTISSVGYGDITPATHGGRIVAVVVITSGIAVLAFTTSLIVSAFNEKLSEIVENKAIEDIYKLRDYYLVCGINDLSFSLIATLKQMHKKVILLDKNETAVAKARERGFHAFAMDPSDVDTYDSLTIDIEKSVHSVILLHESDVDNVSTALSIRSISQGVRMISIVEYGENRKKLKLAGIDEIVYTQELLGLFAKEFTGRPVAFEAIHAIRSSELGVNITEIIVDEMILEQYRRLVDYDFTKFRLILLGVYSKLEGRFIFCVDDNTPIALGDILLVIGELRFIEAFKLDLHSRWRRV